MPFAGFILITIGIYLLYDVFGNIHPKFGLFGISGTAFIALGVALLLSRFFKITKIILGMGILMLLVGGFPWIYTPILLGTRGGDEGSGMLGTLIFIFVGLPGLVTTIIGAILHFLDQE